MYLHHNKELFKQVIIKASKQMGISEAIIEKDYYVSVFLQELSKNCPDVVFKGGTSLSKCYHVINRFSEDIDLNFDNQHKKPTESMRRAFGKAIITTGDTLGLEPINFDKKTLPYRKDYMKLEYSYPAIFPTIYLKPNLLVETSVRSPSFPIEKREVTSLIEDYLISENRNDICEISGLNRFFIKTQSLDRTFTDKIFAVADFYESNETERLSRHMYDLYKMRKHIDLSSEEYKALFSDVLLVRQLQPNNLSAQLNKNMIQDLKQVLNLDYYKNDYINVTSKIIYEDVPYDVVKKNLLNLVSDIDDSKIYENAKEHQIKINKIAKNISNNLETYNSKLESCLLTEDFQENIVIAKHKSSLLSELRQNIRAKMSGLNNQDIQHISKLISPNDKQLLDKYKIKLIDIEDISR
ncbi:MAG: nucleotidyl transferase AbiEii/AbiGii toxin family protein [Eubacterium sp.]|nr:nucleotidyl transferase AbiEii/AbiGii toxin family protein [Eubacterium sp.]